VTQEDATQDRRDDLSDEMDKSQIYFANRTHLIYYEYVKQMVRVLGANAKSMIDVGSANAPYMDSFDWVQTRHALDIQRPYSSPNVKGIKADFLEFQPEIRYDLAVCFQVLEHIKPAKEFAQKLLSIADGVLISVPHKWPEGSHFDHHNDPVSLDKIIDWFGRAPDHHVIVQEPFGNYAKRERLFCYYQAVGQMKTLTELNNTLIESLGGIPRKKKGKRRPVTPPNNTQTEQPQS
jgi:hypothetical protein